MSLTGIPGTTTPQNDSEPIIEDTVAITYNTQQISSQLELAQFHHQ